MWPVMNQYLLVSAFVCFGDPTLLAPFTHAALPSRENNGFPISLMKFPPAAEILKLRLAEHHSPMSAQTLGESNASMKPTRT